MEDSKVSPKLLAESLSRRPVLLIGDVGVGKSIFITNLLKVEAVEELEHAMTFYIDLGSQAALATDLNMFVVDDIIRQLKDVYNCNIDEERMVRGVHHRKLREFRRGIYGRYESENPQLFQTKELELLESLVGARAEHLKASLEHIYRGRNQQLIMFLDNSDQCTDSVQDASFLIAQEIAQNWPVLVFLPLRPETFHRSQQRGALSGYHPKAFTISPPSVELVIKKRLQFAVKLTNGTIEIPSLPGETGRNLQGLETLLETFILSIDRNVSLVECIENISGGNVRLGLDLVRGFFGSGHVDTRKIIEITSKSNSYIVPLHEFVRAMIFGDSVYYDPSRSPIANLFDISSCDGREHFLLPLLLGYLRWAMRARSPQQFVDSDELYVQLQGFGYLPDQIDFALVRAFRKKLVDSEARQSPETVEAKPRSFRITTQGLYHLRRLCGMFTYVDAMTVVTPVLDNNMRSSIGDAMTIDARLERTEQFRRYLDAEWINVRNDDAFFRWDRVSIVLGNEISQIIARLR